MSRIHPLAVVSPEATVASDVTVGPFCVIEAGAEVGSGCRLHSRVVVKRGTTLGTDNEICEGAVLGGRPQHLQAGKQVGLLRIGHGNTIRENATIHVALAPSDCTTVGDGNLIMVNVHIGHDCQISNDTIIANNVMLAGHVSIDDRAYLSGAVGVHQFCRIGGYTMISGQARLTKDVPPFMTVDGETSKVVGLNVIGLRRNHFTGEQIAELKAAYCALYRSELTFGQVLETLAADAQTSEHVAYLRQFVAATKRGIVQERRGGRVATFRLVNREANEVRRAG